MSNVELIVAALGAGATAGLTDTASTAVKDAYSGSKRLLRPRVRGDARTALDSDKVEANLWHARLGEELTASGADTDEEVVAAARRLLELTGPEGTRKYQVGISRSKGVQIGNHNTQTNNF